MATEHKTYKKLSCLSKKPSFIPYYNLYKENAINIPLYAVIY